MSGIVYACLAVAAALIAACAALIEKALGDYSRPRLEDIISDATADRREELKKMMETTLDDEDVALRGASLLKVAFLVAAVVFGLLYVGSDAGWGWLGASLLAAGLVVAVELLPQGVGASYAEEIIIASGKTISVFAWVMMPLVKVSRAIEVGMDRLRGKSVPESEEEEIEEEIKAIVSGGEADGVIDDEARHMIESSLDMLSKNVADIMTPRTDLVCMDVEWTIEKARDLAVKAGHSRIPVFEDTPDKIVGMFYSKDLLRYWGEGPTESIALRDVMREPHFIPETRAVGGLLKELGAHRVHIAVILDEYGGTAGIVTVEDILEEIVGEMRDEYDKEEKPPIRRIDELTVEVDGRVHVDEVGEEIDLEFSDEEDYDTIAGFMVAQFGHIPHEGESFEHEGITFAVVEADDRRIGRARITKHDGR